MDLTRMLDRIIKRDPEKLIKPDRGDTSFNTISGILRSAHRIAKLCRSLPLDAIPTATRARLYGPMAEYSSQLDVIVSFDSVNHHDPGEEMKALCEATEAAFHKAYEALVPHILILTIGTDEFADRFVQMETARDRFESLASTSTREIEIHKHRIETMVSSTEEKVKRLAVAKFEQHYGKVADEHKTSSWYWLGATAISAALAIGFAIDSLTWKSLALTGDFTDAGSIQKVVTRIVVISLLYFAVVWCAKNYRSNLHLYVTNKHRQTALNTFDTLTKAFSEDDSAKNAVLLEAARCMFAPAVSGFLGPEENMPNPIGELIKGGLDSSK